jgi:hypothetical protein
VDVGIGEEGASGLMVPTKSRVLLVLVLALDCFHTGRARTTTTTSTIRKITRLNRPRGRPSCSFFFTASRPMTRTIRKFPAS